VAGDDHAEPGFHSPEGGSSLPVSRSFVVQFTPDTAPAARLFRGRVEHIESGRSRRFTSLDDLAAFVEELLAGGEPA
jgi:hypothetical protein